MRRLHILAALLLPLLAACADGATGTVEQSDAGDGSHEALRALWFGDPAAVGERDEQQVWAEREDAIRACMAVAGQGYVPRPFPRNPLVERQQAERRALEGTRAYAERYGFGMTTTLVDTEIATAYEQRFPYEDPNLVRLEQLPWAERLPFLEALFGPPSEVLRSSATPVPLDRYESTDPGAGCMQQASGGDVGPVHLPPAAVAELEGVESRVAADPQVLAATSAWSVCMGERGYDFAARDEAVRYASEQTGGAIAIVGERNVDVPGPDGETVTLRVVAYDEDQLAEAVRLETAVATADHDCRERAGLTVVEGDARRREQLAWVERWADALAVGAE